ncbi:MAG: hypothetical protein AAB921_01185, partial [Patescibacteria group bacterium]
MTGACIAAILIPSSRIASPLGGEVVYQDDRSPTSIWEARERQGWLGRTIRLPTRFEMSGHDIGSERELMWLYVAPISLAAIGIVVWGLLLATH